MNRYKVSRTKGKILCIPAMHPTRRRGANIRQQATKQGPPLIVPAGEEVVGWIDDTRKTGGVRTW